jgi:hypothetical protein
MPKSENNNTIQKPHLIKTELASLDLPLHALSLPKCCEYIPRFFQKVMYHINPAVIKSILSSMPKEEFYRHARFIHSQSLSLPEGSNRQVMFFNLWQWYLRLHRERFGG